MVASGAAILAIATWVWFTFWDSAEVHMTGGGRVSVNGVTNDPIGAKETVLQTESPLGRVSVRVYDSRLGPCYDLVIADRRTEASCLQGLGVDPSREVTGNPNTGSIEAMSTSFWNAGTTESEIGGFHHGFTHPSVSTVRVESPRQGRAIEALLAHPPDLEESGVFVVWTPEGWEEYVLAGYDGDGCLMQARPVKLTGGFSDPGPPGTTKDCTVRMSGPSEPLLGGSQ